MEVINKISQMLKEQNKKQKDLTDFLGISKNTFTDWKSGRIKSYVKFLPQIAEFLDCSVDYLLGKEKPQTSCDLSLDNSFALSDKEKSIILAYRSHPNMQNAVDTLLNVKSNNDIVSDMSDIMDKGEKIFKNIPTNTK